MELLQLPAQGRIQDVIGGVSQGRTQDNNPWVEKLFAFYIDSLFFFLNFYRFSSNIYIQLYFLMRSGFYS